MVEVSVRDSFMLLIFGNGIRSLCNGSIPLDLTISGLVPYWIGDLFFVCLCMCKCMHACVCLCLSQ